MKPLMFDELTSTERVNLSGLKNHPGYPVLEKLMMSACRLATEAVIALDPTDADYDRRLKVLQSRARDRNEFCLLVLKSMTWQVELEAKLQEELQKPVEKPQENPILRMPKLTNAAPKE